MRDAADLMLPAHLAWLRQAAQSEDTGCGARAALRLRRATQRLSEPKAEPAQPNAVPDKPGP